MTGFEAVRRLNPDFFVHSGDSVYTDGPLQETVALPDGTLWDNLVTPEKRKVAETLAEYRGQFRYNLLDANVRAVRGPGAPVRAVGRPRGDQQRHADPRTTMRYDRARKNLDRHPNYILAAYMASGT